MSIQVTIISLDFDSDEKPRTEGYDKEIINIGRADSNDIVLNSEDVSDFHAQIRVENYQGSKKLYLTDLGTGKGTRLENISIDPNTEVSFEFNKRISIGSYLIKPIHKSAESSSNSSELRKKFSTPRSTPSKVIVRSDLLKSPSEQPEITGQEVKEEKVVVEETQKETPFIPTFKQAEAKDDFKSLYRKSQAKEKSGLRPVVRESEMIQIQMNNSYNQEEQANKFEEIVKKQESDESKDFERKPTQKFDPKDTAKILENKDANFSQTSVLSSNQELSSTSSFSSSSPSTPLSATSSSSVATDSMATELSIKTEGDDISDLDFEALELFTLSGKVQNKGKGLANISVDLGQTGKATTDYDGNFSIEDVEEDTSYEVVINDENYNFNYKNKNGIITSDTKIEIEAIKLFSLAGTITLDGKGLEGVNIDAGRIGKTVSGADGKYEFHKIEEDSNYEITAFKDKLTFENNKLSGMLTSSINNLDFVANKLLTISGKVMHKGKPLQGVEIDAGELGTVLTDANGFYMFDNAKDGIKYTIKAKKGKFSFGTRKDVKGI